MSRVIHNTFGLRRERVRNAYPYLVRMKDGSVKFMIELTRHAASSNVLFNGKKFDREQLIYATVHEEVLMLPTTWYARCLFGREESQAVPVYFFDAEKKLFYHTEPFLHKVCRNKDHMYRLRRTQRVAHEITMEMVHVVDELA